MPISLPRGIAVIATLYFFWAIILFLLTFGPVDFVLVMFGHEQNATVTSGVALEAYRPLMPFVAAIAVLLGWGLLKGKDWAQFLTIALATLGVLQAVFSLSCMHSVRSVRVLGFCRWQGSFSQLTIGAWVIWYLLRPDVKAAFQTKVSAI